MLIVKITTEYSFTSGNATQYSAAAGLVFNPIRVPGRNTEALEVLIYLRGSETLASNELKEYSLQTTSSKTTTMEIIKNKIFLKSFALVMILVLGGQFSGFNSVSFYLQTILESTETSITPEVCSVIIGLIQLLACFCTTLITDRFGRKPILTSTMTGLAVGMVRASVSLIFGAEKVTRQADNVHRGSPLCGYCLRRYTGSYVLQNGTR